VIESCHPTAHPGQRWLEFLNFKSGHRRPNGGLGRAGDACALAQALVEAGRPSAPVSVRIDYVILGPSSGEGGPAGSSPDQMMGAVITGGVARPLRAETWYSLSAADAATTAASNYGRVYQLSRAFALLGRAGYSGT
jgi:hypothetical protein